MLTKLWTASPTTLLMWFSWNRFSIMSSTRPHVPCFCVYDNQSQVCFRSLPFSLLSTCLVWVSLTVYLNVVTACPVSWSSCILPNFWIHLTTFLRLILAANVLRYDPSQNGKHSQILISALTDNHLHKSEIRAVPILSPVGLPWLPSPSLRRHVRPMFFASFQLGSFQSICEELPKHLLRIPISLTSSS